MLILQNCCKCIFMGTTSKLYFCVNMQAEPLVIDLKDLFQVIFNMRKKEAESSQKVKF